MIFLRKSLCLSESLSRALDFFAAVFLGALALVAGFDFAAGAAFALAFFGVALFLGEVFPGVALALVVAFLVAAIFRGPLNKVRARDTDNQLSMTLSFIENEGEHVKKRSVVDGVISQNGVVQSIRPSGCAHTGGPLERLEELDLAGVVEVVGGRAMDQVEHPESATGLVTIETVRVERRDGLSECAVGVHQEADVSLPGLLI